VFFAIAQAFGAFGSHWYGHLIGNGTDRNSLFVGYLVGAGAMIVGGIAAIIFGVNAEGKPLEEVAKPLSVIGKPSEAIFRTGADEVGGMGSRPAPDQRLAEHDDHTQTRPDDGTPLV
jgi:hypothetical protein